MIVDQWSSSSLLISSWPISVEYFWQFLGSKVFGGLGRATILPTLNLFYWLFGMRAQSAWTYHNGRVHLLVECEWADIWLVQTLSLVNCFSLSHSIEYVKSGEIVRTDRGPCLFIHLCPAFGKRKWVYSSLSALVSHCILGLSENF